MAKIIRAHKDYPNNIVTTVTGEVFNKTSEVNKKFNEYLENIDLARLDEIRSYIEQDILMIVDEKNDKKVDKNMHLPNDDDAATMKEVVSEENDEEIEKAKANATEDKDNDEIISELEEGGEDE